MRGLHLCQSAEPRLAIAELTAVIRELRRYGDERWLANALIGRGIARCNATKLVSAEADFSAAQTVLLAMGEPGRAAMCLHNRGFVAMLAGDLPLALRRYEEAAKAGLDSASLPRRSWTGPRRCWLLGSPQRRGGCWRLRWNCCGGATGTFPSWRC